MKNRFKYFWIATLSMIVSCQSVPEQEHTHGEEGEQGHSHNEDLAVDTTLWTDKTELFVEYPPLVVGQISRFAAHFTVLEKHQPVREGSVTVSLIQGNQGIRHTVEAPSSPGIFTPSLQPKEPGIYTLLFEIKTSELNDRIEAGKVQVFASRQDAATVLGEEEEDGGTISFLKEQAWKIDFQTVPVSTGKVYELIPTSGKWLAAPGTENTVSAIASGMVFFPSTLIIEGAEVRRGDLLFTISGKGLAANNLQTELIKAQATYEQAQAAYERKKPLFENQVVPKAEFEEVKKQYEIARAEYESLAAGYSSNGKQIRAPFNGYIKKVWVENGAFVNQGAPLVVIGTEQSHVLQTEVSQAYGEQLKSIQQVWFTTSTGRWTSLEEVNGSLKSIGKVVNQAQPLIPVFFQVNGALDVLEGSMTEVQLATGEEKEGVLIPAEALLEDFGNYSVIVQLGGETFERRPIKIGKRNGGQVEVTQGLEAGEYIVTTGAYQVKMASMSGQVPAHGHSH